MTFERTLNEEKPVEQQEKILLVMLPLWDRLIPPMGISCLKSYLRQHGYEVKTADTNILKEFYDSFTGYFDHLKEVVPVEKRGNFYNIVHGVVHDHMMAHLNHDDEQQYIRIVKIIISKTFFCTPDDKMILGLNKIIDEYYKRLGIYVLNLLEKEKPTILGLSVYSSTLPSSLFTFKLAKKTYPDLKTIMGGGIFTNQLAPGSPNLDFFCERTRDYIDKLIIGEGENLFVKYLKGEFPGSQRILTLQDIGGQLLDLSTVEEPDFSDFDLSYYQYLANYGGRSCPGNCSFCSETVLWGKYRKKSAPQVVDELEELYKKHGCQLLLMCDCLLNPLITEFAQELIKRNVAIYWDCYLRADKPVCNTRNTLLWRRGGFYRARLGLESGSQKILDLMGKKITPAQIVEAVSSLANAGIKTTTYWIIGYPGETEEDFQQTLELIECLKDDIYEVDCNPFVYSLTGQVGDEAWQQQKKSLRLYPEDARDMLITETWYIDGEPSREETYRRLNRFTMHCQKLGIPNPYSMYDIHEADLRWKKLHKNAVPPLMDFQESDGVIDENKNMKELLLVKQFPRENKDFDF
jgi:radical SAM superfamily enzyme YgiQ (UPF0313 family)